MRTSPRNGKWTLGGRDQKVNLWLSKRDATHARTHARKDIRMEPTKKGGNYGGTYCICLICRIWEPGGPQQTYPKYVFPSWQGNDGRGGWGVDCMIPVFFSLVSSFFSFLLLILFFPHYRWPLISLLEDECLGPFSFLFSFLFLFPFFTQLLFQKGDAVAPTYLPTYLLPTIPSTTTLSLPKYPPDFNSEPTAVPNPVLCRVVSRTISLIKRGSVMGPL